MKIIVVGAGGTVGRSAVRHLRARLTASDELVLVRRGPADTDPEGGPAITVLDVRLPLTDWPAEFADADVLLSCAGPSYRYTDALARRCDARGVAYVDVGGDRPCLDALARVEPTVPILLGAGVQPGLLAWLIGEVAEPGADVLALCGGAQPLSQAAVAEYARSVTDPDGWPGRAWVAGSPETDTSAPPVPPTASATVHLHLDAESADLAARIGPARLRCFNVVDAPRIAAALGRLVSGEISVDDVLDAARHHEGADAESDRAPYFTIAVTSRGPTGVRRARITVDDSYALSGAVAAATVLAVRAEPAGARWASASAAAASWADVVEVDRTPTAECIVVGATFGRVYAQALAADRGPLALVGIGGVGGPRSTDLAATLDVPALRGTVSGVDAAVVAVRGEVVGGAGDELVDDLLRAGVCVLQEHPVDARAMGRHLQIAAEHGLRYAPTGFYEHLPTSRRWMAAMHRLRSAGAVAHLSVRTSMQVLERALLIVADGLEAVPLEAGRITPIRPGAFLVSADWGGVAVDIAVNNRRDPDDPDANSHPIFSAAAVTGGGELSWPHIHAPLRWTPHPEIVVEDHVAAFTLLDDEDSADRSADVAALWASAVRTSVHAVLDSAATPTPVSGRHLAVVDWWQHLCARAPQPELIGLER
ncbi:Gfo/Idh/MocA family oxidoreductase [Gordonia hydrophobica]|uniref:Gfo/Idh/MocA family oxidoreductase n=1 Tax=Gordonia hydrophobica TaxID=40516 RepID=A0ABZ2U336_9ACTN|nr:Gfo/Idh/MocA family oxidoreductase [Gordonia hydrophobica]MBM7367311.1 thiazolinyl imide reductase [Gordonia hydrophobica]